MSSAPEAFTRFRCDSRDQPQLAAAAMSELVQLALACAGERARGASSVFRPDDPVAQAVHSREWQVIACANRLQGHVNWTNAAIYTGCGMLLVKDSWT